MLTWCVLPCRRAPSPLHFRASLRIPGTASSYSASSVSDQRNWNVRILPKGMCCNFENMDGRRRERKLGGGEVSGRQIEQPIDELILSANIRAAEPTRLPLADHVQRLVSCNRSLSCAELPKALLGLHTSFDRPMILLQDVVQISHRSLAAAAAQDSFPFHSGNPWAIE